MSKHKHKHRAKIAHHVPGRMRLKVDTAKGNDALMEEIRQTLVNVPGIHDIQINSSTGSVTVHYAADAHPEIETTIERHQQHFSVHAPSTKLDDMTKMITDEAEFLAEHSHSARVVVDFCKHIDTNIKKATNNTLDLKVLLPLGLAGVAFLEIGATAATPVWVTIALFSLNHFVELQAHQAAARRERGNGQNQGQEQAQPGPVLSPSPTESP
jgi:hypothetical protein